MIKSWHSADGNVYANIIALCPVNYNFFLIFILNWIYDPTKTFQ